MFDYKKVEELYPGAGQLMIEPQLIHKGTDSQLKNCDDGTWFAQLKKDGALYMYVKGLNGENYPFDEEDGIDYIKLRKVGKCPIRLMSNTWKPQFMVCDYFEKYKRLQPKYEMSIWEQVIIYYYL